MPLMDEFKEERESIKNQSFKKKLEYFWTYYKWWVIGGIVAIALIISTIVHLVKSKNEVLYVAVLDAVPTVGEDIEGTITEPFLSEHGYNLNKNTINFNTNFMFSQKDLEAANTESEGSPSSSATQGFQSRENLAIYIAAGDVDAICGSEEWFNVYAEKDFFYPLSEYLTEDEINALSDKVYYTEIEGESVACGICLENSELFNKNFAYVNEGVDESHVVIGIIRNTDNTELMGELIKYMANGGSN
jgi:hypothetical protein